MLLLVGSVLLLINFHTLADANTIALPIMKSSRDAPPAIGVVYFLNHQNSPRETEKNAFVSGNEESNIILDEESDKKWEPTDLLPFDGDPIQDEMNSGNRFQTDVRMGVETEVPDHQNLPFLRIQRYRNNEDNNNKEDVFQRQHSRF